MNGAKAKITRYADDFVIQARYVGTRLRGWIESVLENRFQLQINREKTKIVRLGRVGLGRVGLGRVGLGRVGQWLDFLGFAFRFDEDRYGRRNHYFNLFPGREALKTALEEIASLTGPERFEEEEEGSTGNGDPPYSTGFDTLRVAWWLFFFFSGSISGGFGFGLGTGG